MVKNFLRNLNIDVNHVIIKNVHTMQNPRQTLTLIWSQNWKLKNLLQFVIVP